MPADPVAERAILSSIFNHGSVAHIDAADLITAKTFSIETNQVIYRCLEHILKDDTKPDYPSLLSAANSLGLNKVFDDKAELKHLRSIMNMPVDPGNTRKMAAKIRRLEIGRLLEVQLDSSKESLQGITGDEPLAHLLGLVENPIFDFTSLLNDGANHAIVPMGKDGVDYVKDLMNNPRNQVGIKTGFPIWDDLVGGGIRPGGLDIWGARQKTGKTFAVDNLGINIAQQGVNVLNIDTEMSREEHLNRVLARLANLKTRDIERGVCGQNQLSRQKLEKAAKQLEELPYDYLCAVGMPFEEILAHARRWLVRRVGLNTQGRVARDCVIIYDWLKLNSANDINRNLQELHVLGFITSGLKNFMSRYGCGCVCFSQLNREGIDTEDTSVIRGADRILDFCSSFSIFKWKNDEEMAANLGDVRYTHKLIPLLSRFGPAIKFPHYINVASDYDYAILKEGPLSNAINSQVARPTGEFVVDEDTLQSSEEPWRTNENK